MIPLAYSALVAAVAAQVASNVTWPDVSNNTQAELDYLHSLRYVGLDANNHPYEPKKYDAPAIRNPHPKAVDLLNQLTTEEKVDLVTGRLYLGASGNIAPLERLNLSTIRYQDGPAGPRAVLGTSGFAPELTLAATWDRNLVQQHSEAMGAENRDKGIHVALGPVTGGPQGRSPFSGRVFENFGNDPVLTAELSYVAVQGIQSQGVQVSAKHFLGYEQETFRFAQTYAPARGTFTWEYTPFPPGKQMQIDSVIGDRAIHEVYTWAFAEAVRAGASSVMCSYNRVNGTQSCENSHTLSKILKTEMDFQGYVVSDWGALQSTKESILAGCDLDMGGQEVSTVNGDIWGPTLLKMVKNGTVPESRLNDAILRVFTPYYSLGQDSWDPETKFNSTTTEKYYNGTLVNPLIDVTRNHSEVIREVGTAAITLLKNSGGLPLKNDSALGLFGSDAGPSPYGTGCPSVFEYCPIDSKNNGTTWTGGGSGASSSSRVVTPLEAINSRVLANGGTVVYDLTDDGYNQQPSNGSGAINAYNRTIGYSDTAIVFVSIKSFEGQDLESLHLANNGDELIKQVASLCNNTIVVIHSTNPPIVSDWIDHPNVTGVLNAYIPGDQSGNSLVPILFGDVSPSGKLPYTIAKNESDYIQPMKEPEIDPKDVFDEELLLDYRRFDEEGIEPQFPFGFGLSYTTFDYTSFDFNTNLTNSNLTLGWRNSTTPSLYATAATAKVGVKNTGNVTGSEVVQIYVQYPDSAGEPPKVLRGFEKIRDIAPGQTKTANINLNRKSFSVWDVAAQEWVIPHGTFIVSAAAHSRDLRLNQTLTL